MNNQEFIERLKVESEELNSKTTLLCKFLSDDVKTKDISLFQLEMLKKQVEYMKHYASCLNLRIDDLLKDK